MWGPALGAFILVPAQQWLAYEYGTSQVYLIAYAAVFLIIIILLPRGILPSIQESADEFGGRRRVEQVRDQVANGAHPQRLEFYHRGGIVPAQGPDQLVSNGRLGPAEAQRRTARPSTRAEATYRTASMLSGSAACRSSSTSRAPWLATWRSSRTVASSASSRSCPAARPYPSAASHSGRISRSP